MSFQTEYSLEQIKSWHWPTSMKDKFKKAVSKDTNKKTILIIGFKRSVLTINLKSMKDTWLKYPCKMLQLKKFINILLE